MRENKLSYTDSRYGNFFCRGVPPEFNNLKIDKPALEEAKSYYRRGNIAEAMIWLERALPDTFSGLANRVRPL